MDDERTMPCKHCGTPTRMLGTQMCDGCWETRKSGELDRCEADRDRLAAALEASTKWLIAERDSLYECITDSEGNIPKGEDEDADYLRQLDTVIDANRAALAKAKGES